MTDPSKSQTRTIAAIRQLEIILLDTPNCSATSAIGLPASTTDHKPRRAPGHTRPRTYTPTSSSNTGAFPAPSRDFATPLRWSGSSGAMRACTEVPQPLPCHSVRTLSFDRRRLLMGQVARQISSRYTDLPNPQRKNHQND